MKLLKKKRRQTLDCLDISLNIYKELNKAETERNKVKVGFIENGMTNLKKEIENVSKDHVDKIEQMNKTAYIIEFILYFNNNDQERSGLKILIARQILSKLPISLAH